MRAVSFLGIYKSEPDFYFGFSPTLNLQCVQTRETREGWPLLTVETEVNGDSKSTNEGTRDFCPALAALVGPVQNNY
jgi:hypothetical protein